MTDKRVLLLGHTGKMGTALDSVFGKDYELICKNSRDYNARDFEAVRSLIKKNRPDILLNTVAFGGVDACEENPNLAFRVNTLYPKLLAELSIEEDYLLVHFSTSAVFNGKKGDYYTESDCPSPLNNYGLTKFGGDCYINATANRYYIIRIPILFGETSKQNQFIEKMLQRVISGDEELRISNDIVSNPTYSLDVAVEVRRLVENSLPYGLYHVCNEDTASLFDLMKEVAEALVLDVSIKGVPCSEFPSLGAVNKYTALRSEKIPFLRDWKEAVREYCRRLKLQEATKNERHAK